MKKAVLFDLDGTLIDTAPDFIRIIKNLCQKHHRPTPTDTAIRAEVSAGARAMVRLMLDKADLSDDDPQLLAYRQEFLDAYEQDICVDSRLFDGLDNLLISLENQGIAWGIVTNKPRYLAVQLLAKLQLDKRCAVLVCPDDVARTKPDPEPLFLACNQLAVAPTACIYVGDHIRDIQAGRSAGMATVVAKFGYLSLSDQVDEWGADFVVDTPSELVNLIHHWLIS